VTIAEKAAKVFKIEPAEIFIKSRIQSRADARALYCFWAVRELETPLIEIAKALKITSSGVAYAVQKGEILAKERGLKLID
jgi:chromosomal replication initiation ATPase DnaA